MSVRPQLLSWSRTLLLQEAWSGSTCGPPPPTLVPPTVLGQGQDWLPEPTCPLPPLMATLGLGGQVPCVLEDAGLPSP